VPAARLREIYPPSYYSYAAPHHTLAFSIKHWLDRRFFRSILRRFGQPALRVLDVGGGAGWELSSLRASDPRVRETWVVDLDPEAAAIAERNGHRYVCGPIEEFEPIQKFDLIMMLNLIEHVLDPEAVLRRVAGILAPGGLVLLKTPNFDSWDARLFRQRNWIGYHCPRHWILFSRDSFTRLTDRVGLRVDHTSYTQGASFWAGSVLAWLAARGLVAISRKRPLLEHPLFGMTAVAFAAFDFLRRPFAKTSQMLFVLSHTSA
jgi:SAM-dependent methyltransferase